MPDPRANDPHTPAIDKDGDPLVHSAGIKLHRATRSEDESDQIAACPDANAVPYGIVAAPSGAIYFCEFGTNKLASIDPKTMTITEYALPNTGSRPRRLALAPDGTIYYADYARDFWGISIPQRSALKNGLRPAERVRIPTASLSLKMGLSGTAKAVSNRIRWCASTRSPNLFAHKDSVRGRSGA